MPGPFTFPRHERLTRRSDYQDVYEHGEKSVGRGFICFVVRREGVGRKFGLAVSRKVGKAVVRNRVKRYIREIYRTRRPQLISGVSMVIVARPSAAALNFSESADAIDRLFRAVEVLGE